MLYHQKQPQYLKTPSISEEFRRILRLRIPARASLPHLWVGERLACWDLTSINQWQHMLRV
jgi:hypothetical protein